MKQLILEIIASVCALCMLAGCAAPPAASGADANGNGAAAASGVTGNGGNSAAGAVSGTAEPDPFVETEAGTAGTGGLMLVTSRYGAFDEASGKEGFYKLYPKPEGGCNILYADYATHSAVVLCNRPDCLHRNEECPSWFPFDTGSIFLNAAQDTLFCIGNADVGAQRAETIWRMDLNGANRRIFYQCAAHERITDAIASDASSLYFVVLSVDFSTAAAEERLLQVDLQTGELPESIPERRLSLCFFTQSGCHRAAYENRHFKRRFSASVRELPVVWRGHRICSGLL